MVLCFFVARVEFFLLFYLLVNVLSVLSLRALGERKCVLCVVVIKTERRRSNWLLFSLEVCDMWALCKRSRLLWEGALDFSKTGTIGDRRKEKELIGCALVLQGHPERPVPVVYTKKRFERPVL